YTVSRVQCVAFLLGARWVEGGANAASYSNSGWSLHIVVGASQHNSFKPSKRKRGTTLFDFLPRDVQFSDAAPVWIAGLHRCLRAQGLSTRHHQVHHSQAYPECGLTTGRLRA